MKASEADLYQADEAGVLALVIDDEFVAFLVAEVLWLIEVCVGVSAEQHVDACGAADEVLIHVGVVLPSEVAEADDEVARFFIPQAVDDGLCCLGGTCVAHSFEVLARDESFGLRADAEDAYAPARTFYYYIWADKSFARRACEVVVATDEGEVGHPDESGQIVEAEVELMVADGAGIVAHEVHELHLYFALVQVVVDGALAEVAAVEEECFGMLLTYLVEECHTAQIAALACLSRIAEVGRDGFDAGVRVAGVDEEKLTLLGKG